MFHTENRQQLRIEIETQECKLESDELARLQEPLDRVAEAVNDLPATTLKLTPHVTSAASWLRIGVAEVARLPKLTLNSELLRVPLPQNQVVTQH